MVLGELRNFYYPCKNKFHSERKHVRYLNKSSFPVKLDSLSNLVSSTDTTCMQLHFIYLFKKSLKIPKGNQNP
jgi:hypothetical protein